MSNLIYGINPLVISTIAWRTARRHGTHPSMLKYLSKKNPIKNLFGFYESDYFDRFEPSKVIIYGSDGDILKIIECRSNISAKELRDNLMKQLETFITNLKGVK